MSLIKITSKCNQQCVFCSNTDKINNKKIDFNIKNVNDRLIQLSGGEPLKYDINDLLKLLYIFLKHKKIIEFQTNATLIESIDKKKLKLIISIINKSKGYFNINFSSHNPKTDYKITGLKGGFKNRVSGIKILNKYNAKIRLTYVINKYNYKYITDFARFIKKEIPFVSWIQFSFVKGIGKAKNNKKIVPEYKKVSPYLIKALDILTKYKIKFDIDHIPLCYLGKYWKHHVDVYKIKKGIQGEYQKEKNKNFKKCVKCKLNKYCSGPRKDYIAIYGKI